MSRTTIEPLLPASGGLPVDGSRCYHSGWDSALIEQWVRSIAWRLSHSPILDHLDRSDIEQELRLHLLGRIKYFSETRGDHWSYFVTARLREAAGSIIEYYRAQLRCPDRPVVPLSSQCGSDPSDKDDHRCCPKSVDDTSPSPLSRWELREDVPVVLSTFNSNEQALCRCLMRMSVAATARELGLPRSTVMDSIRRMRRRFDDAGLRDFL
jgi:hypothetical protein